MYRIIYFVLLGIISDAALLGQTIEMREGWKFKQGDSMQWSSPEYNDASWTSINPGRAWESQGYKGYDGYAWYRFKVVIPSILKSQSSLQDEIKFFMGGIDNYDQCFLNGSMIGQNTETVTGSSPSGAFVDLKVAWNVNRVYTLSCKDSRIRWDKDNIIAIRVYDVNGNGGMWSGTPSVTVLDAVNFISLKVRDIPFDQHSKNKVSKYVRLSNISENYNFSGLLNIKAYNAKIQQTLLDTSITIILPKNQSVDIPFSIKHDNQEIVRVNYCFTEAKSKHEFSDFEYLPYGLTPVLKESPQINYPRVFAARPGHPVFFKIPVSGKAPLKYSIADLPKGLNCNPRTGIVSGIVMKKGRYTFDVAVGNDLGSDKSTLTLSIDDTIALTPPMCWNSYYCSWNEVTEADVRKAARLMKESGLINHGYTYINVDDGWPGKRDSIGNIQPNEKFGDMKALGEFIHAQDLKFGIYNSPGVRTCAGLTGTYNHEFQDVLTYEKWGVDYLKYDWCSYDDLGDANILADLKRPYALMRQALTKANRDIVFSLCQYGMGDVWTWGKSIGGNLWRTTFDITDSWGSLKSIAFQQYKFAKFTSPGGWNDPDMLLMGWFHAGRELHPSNLTLPEQYTQFTLWALLSAPLVLSCDFSYLDQQTLSIISNDEVIAVDQDPLGKGATQVSEKDGFQIYTKDLYDGNKVISIFNMNDNDAFFNLNLKDLNFESVLKIRDLWKQRDIQSENNIVKIFLPAHGPSLLKIIIK